MIDNLSFGSSRIRQVDGIEFHEIDIRDGEGLKAAVRQINPHAVVHLAAIHFIPYCNEHPYEAADVNVGGTMKVLDACEGCSNLEKVIFASTAAVYPIQDGAITETHPLGPVDIYGLSKMTGERLCSEFHLRTEVPAATCRFFNAFGPNETNPHLIPEIQRQVLSGARTIRLGNTTPKRDFIHTTDMSEGMLALIQEFNEGCEVFNIGRGLEYSVIEVVKAFESAVGEPIEIEVDPARVRKVERMHLLADITRLTDRTGWEPRISLEDGIKTLVDSGEEINYEHV